MFKETSLYDHPGATLTFTFPPDFHCWDQRLFTESLHPWVTPVTPGVSLLVPAHSHSQGLLPGSALGFPWESPRCLEP